MIDPLLMFTARPAAEKPAVTADQAVKGFETLFVKQLLDQMPLDTLTGPHAALFTSLVTDALAEELVKAGGIGLAAQLGPALERHSVDHGAPRQPVAGLSSGYGLRTDPIDGTARMHEGIDLAAPKHARIPAARDGVVRFAGRAGGYGNLVVIDHGGGLETRYAHCNAISVKVGEAVTAGQPVATVGSTGRSTGPHLHFEVRRDGLAVDPRPLVNAAKPIADPIREGVQEASGSDAEGSP